MSIVFRPARLDELQRAEDLVVQSINDVATRHGFGAFATSRPADFESFSLRDDPDGLWVAESGGEMLGFGFSWACGDLWFLAELFVAPGRQAAGIGGELLARTFAHAEKSGATRRALITFAFNVAAQGLYIRHGFLPRLPIYFCSAPRETLVSRLRGQGLASNPIAGTQADFASLAEIDREVLGVSREKHHRYLLGLSPMKGVFFEAEGERIGYAYISATGQVGPLAVTRRDAMAGAFTAALGHAVETGAPQVSAFLSGSNARCLALAAEFGLRITLPMVLMSSEEFGDWSRYSPRNPGFM